MNRGRGSKNDKDCDCLSGGAATVVCADPLLMRTRLQSASIFDASLLSRAYRAMGYFFSHIIGPPIMCEKQAPDSDKLVDVPAPD